MSLPGVFISRGLHTTDRRLVVLFGCLDRGAAVVAGRFACASADRCGCSAVGCASAAPQNTVARPQSGMDPSILILHSQRFLFLFFIGRFACTSADRCGCSAVGCASPRLRILSLAHNPVLVTFMLINAECFLFFFWGPSHVLQLTDAGVAQLAARAAAPENTLSRP